MSLPAASTNEAAISLTSIQAMSEEELKQFVLENYIWNAICPLSKKQWKKINELRQRNLFAKFRQVADSLRKQPPVGHPPLDFTRLEEFLKELVLDPKVSTTKDQIRSYPVDVRVEYDSEREHHDQLVQDGGRPAYNIDRFEEVTARVGEYYQLMIPWEGVETTEWTCAGRHDQVFERQFCNWHSFRMWQRFNRSNDKTIGDENKDGNLLRATRERGRIGQSYVNKKVSYFEHDTWGAAYQAKSFDSFDSYEEAVKQKLVLHSVDHAGLILDIDPQKQNKLTTWLEYLSFQYFHMQWEEDWMKKHREDAESGLDHVVGNMMENYSRRPNTTLYVPETVEELIRAMDDAWYMAKIIDAYEQYRSAARVRGEAAQNQKAYGEDPAAAPEEVRREYQRAQTECRNRNFDYKYFSLLRITGHDIAHNSSYPYFISAWKLHEYEKLSLWVHAQLPLVQEEMKAEETSPKGRKRRAPDEEIGSPAPASRASPKPTSLAAADDGDDEPTAAAGAVAVTVTHSTGGGGEEDIATQAAQPEEDVAPLVVEHVDADGPPPRKKRKRRFLPPPGAPLRRSARIADRLERQAKEAEAALAAARAKAEEEAKAEEAAKKKRRGRPPVKSVRKAKGAANKPRKK